MTKKKSEYDALQLIANEQHELQKKKGSNLAKKLELLSRKRAAWIQTGIPQMWEDVKHIEVKNFARHNVAGETPPLVDFVSPLAECNIYGTGLALHDSRFAQAVWHVIAENDRKADSPLKYVTYDVGYVNTPEEMRQSFIKWLARRIDHRVVVDLGYTPKEVKKAERRILLEATN